MPVPANPFRPVGQVAIIPQDVPATNLQRVATLDRGIASDQKAQLQALAQLPRASQTGFALASATAATSVLGIQAPLTDALRDKAVAFVDAQLVAQGLLDKVGGVVSTRSKTEVGYERRTSIPTAGVIVKACLDTCSACEPALEKKIDLELQRLELQNQLLAKQVALLEQSQEYRCCPPAAQPVDH
jgi:hypothetical protein